MSGHSHWAGIKHKKELEDKKRSKIFSKLARAISIAARSGPNPQTNSQLRLAIEKAKGFNMPNQNIERAIQRGSGQTNEGNLEEFTIQAYGPGKVAIIIEGITDNKNRSLSQIKQILAKFDGKLSTPGSVKWMFKRLGVISVKQDKKDRDVLELSAIEAGAEDIRWKGSVLEIYVKPEDIEKTKAYLEQQNIHIESANLEWVPDKEIEIDQKEKNKLENLFNALDDNDDVQEIYSNLKN